MCNKCQRVEIYFGFPWELRGCGHNLWRNYFFPRLYPAITHTLHHSPWPKRQKEVLPWVFVIHSSEARMVPIHSRPRECNNPIVIISSQAEIYLKFKLIIRLILCTNLEFQIGLIGFYLSNGKDFGNLKHDKLSSTNWWKKCYQCQRKKLLQFSGRQSILEISSWHQNYRLPSESKQQLWNRFLFLNQTSPVVWFFPLFYFLFNNKKACILIEVLLVIFILEFIMKNDPPVICLSSQTILSAISDQQAFWLSQIIDFLFFFYFWKVHSYR